MKFHWKGAVELNLFVSLREIKNTGESSISLIRFFIKKRTLHRNKIKNKKKTMFKNNVESVKSHFFFKISIKVKCYKRFFDFDIFSILSERKSVFFLASPNIIF